MSLLLSFLVLQAVATDPAPSDWLFRNRGKDAITGLESSIASVNSLAGGDKLTVQCDAVDVHVLSILYIPKKFTGRSGSQQVIFKFGNDEAGEYSAEPVSSAKAITDPYQVNDLAHRLARSEVVTVRAFNYNDQPVDARFEIRGGEQSIRAVFATCGIPFDKPEKKKRK